MPEPRIPETPGRSEGPGRGSTPNFPGDHGPGGVEPVTNLPAQTGGLARAPQPSRSQLRIQAAMNGEDAPEFGAPLDGARVSAPGPARPAAPSPPPGGGYGDGAAPEAYSGADWRKRVKAVKSQQAAAARNRRGKYLPRHASGAQRGAAGPGMLRRNPPPDGAS